MFKSIKAIAALLLALMTAVAVCGCGAASDTEDSELGTGTYTGSGHEYRAVVEDGRANIKYLDAILDIDEAEFVEDDFDDQTYLVLHMEFTNDSTLYRPEGDEDTTFYMDSLDSAFVLQAVQDGNVIEHRSEAETESLEEDNCWKKIDSGHSLECEMYFPVEPGMEVTIQVLNPDGEDTVMAELTYEP